jgi:hypothetical protein
MAQPVIEFDWMRDPKGYRLAKSGGTKMWNVVRNGKGHSPEDLEPCRPLSLTDSLFRIFANIATTPEGVLDFVQRYGPLTWAGWDSTQGDQVALVIHNAQHMSHVLKSAAGEQKNPGLLSNDRATGTPSSVDAWVVWDRSTKEFKWELRPKTLLDALWLQLGQWLTTGTQIRACKHCGNWFAAGRGTGRRAGTKFCSDEHKIAFHSLKRSKEK